MSHDKDKEKKPKPHPIPPRTPTDLDTPITAVLAEGCPDPGPPAPPGCQGDAIVVCGGAHNFGSGTSVYFASLAQDLRDWVGHSYLVEPVDQFRFKVYDPREDNQFFSWDNLINNPNAGTCRSAGPNEE